ncbi:MAG: TIGR04076 family protein [Thermodesulfobacteriota bacterium]
MDEYKIMGKIVEIRGKGVCSYGHQVEEVFEIKERGSTICQWAMTSMFPFFTALKFGGRFPWSQDPDRIRISCPDPDNVVVFELWREREKNK